MKRDIHARLDVVPGDVNRALMYAAAASIRWRRSKE